MPDWKTRNQTAHSLHSVLHGGQYPVRLSLLLVLLSGQAYAFFLQGLNYFKRLRVLIDFKEVSEGQINSGGYVVDTIEAAIWCLLNTTSYRECVLKAINLGADTDTTGAVAGGLAGLYYGYEDIPKEWIMHMSSLTYSVTILAGKSGRKQMLRWMRFGKGLDISVFNGD